MNAPDSISRRSNLDPQLIRRHRAAADLVLFRSAAGSMREMRLLFGNGPGYVGHRLMVPEVGDYKTLRGPNTARFSVHGPDGIQLLSNTCRHRQGLLLEVTAMSTTSFARCIAGPNDFERHVAGRAGLRSHPDCALPKSAVQDWQGLCSPARARRQPISRFALTADYDFFQLCVRPDAGRGMSVQLEEFSRDLSRALSRRSRAPGPAEVGRFG